MDPNAARSKMIEKANVVLGTPEAPHPDDAVALAEAVHDLDEWLRAGGFLPTAWDKGEQPGRVQAMNEQATGDTTEQRHRTGERCKAGHPGLSTALDYQRCVLEEGHYGDHNLSVT